MATATDIKKKLTETLSEVTYIEVTDTSSGCGASYSVVLVSPDFEGKSTLARHRWVNDILKDQIAQMHAFAQKSYSPKQWEMLKNKSETT